MVRKETNMKRTSILALLSALAIPALGEDLKITMNQHSATEINAAAAAGFDSVEDFYADLDRALATSILKQTWDSLSPDIQRSLQKPETKWRHWYNSLPHKTRRDLLRQTQALRKHNSELEAWLPKPAATPVPVPPTFQEAVTPHEYLPGTERQPSEDRPTRPPTIQESGTPHRLEERYWTRPPTAEEKGTPQNQ